MSDRDLILKAANLARRAPQDWEQFIGALKIYTDIRRDQCVSSPVDTLQVAQGRAQQSASLLRLLEECVKTADQMTEKNR
jgi:hypothetical protein